MIDASDLDVANALARDVAAARRLAETLVEHRSGHPALQTLALFTEEAPGSDRMVLLASIAFEAGVRFHWGKLAGDAANEEACAEMAAPLLVERAPMPWEPDENLAHPYREMDWRRAMAEAGEELRSGAFAVPEVVPGAALVASLIGAGDRTTDGVDALLGDAPRDEVVDPVAVHGSFLAQALPGFVDLDQVLRQHRVRQIERSVSS